MSRRGQVRKAVRWARYFNHYGHMPDVFLGGRSANRVIWLAVLRRQHSFVHVRRQAKHRFGARRPS